MQMFDLKVRRYNFTTNEMFDYKWQCLPVIFHAFDPTKELSADVAGRERVGVVLVRPLVDDQVVVFGERPLAVATLEVLDGGAALPVAVRRSNRLETFGRGHRGALQRVDGKHDEVLFFCKKTLM
jgi:hypothetical protein